MQTTIYLAQGDKKTKITGQYWEATSLRELQRINQKIIFLTPFSQVRERWFEAHGDEKIRYVVVKTEESYIHKKKTLPAIMYLTPRVHDDDFISMVHRAQEEIKKGNTSQIVLSRHFDGWFETFDEGTHQNIFDHLCEISGTYMTYLFIFPDGNYVAAASPERHLTLTGKEAIMSPIAGTLPKWEKEWLSERIQDFLKDKKEINELAMVMDETLKMMVPFCPHGGKITGPFLRETGSVIHTEYDIIGQRNASLHPLDILLSTLNAPTLVGSPLEEACKCIKKIETHARGYYAGVFGILDGHNLDSCITIRCISGDAVWHFALQAGAGIVRDSLPEKEMLETIHKSSWVRKILSGSGKSEKILDETTKEILEQEAKERNKELNEYYFQTNIREEVVEIVWKKVLVIDHEDAFAGILTHMIRTMGTEVTCKRHDYVSKKDVIGSDILVLSGGPWDINDMSDKKMNRIRSILQNVDKPVLGICLGCQALCQYFWISVQLLTESVQGTQQTVVIDRKSYKVAHYNSFAGHGNHENLEILHDSEGNVVTLFSPEKQWFGVQFHPESVMTQHGYQLLISFLKKICSK